MLKRIALVLVLLVIAALLFLQFSERPEPLPSHLKSAQMLERGPHEVGVFDVTLVDETRPTQANSDYPGTDSRTLKTRVWYPADMLGGDGEPATSPRPLLVYSHGFMSTRTGGAYHAEHLASLGYIVASMDYPLTHFNAPGEPLVKDVVNQPEDVSFLLDHFLSWHDDPGHDFFGAVDSDRIGVYGLSLGGMTTTMVAFHPSLGDSRVNAAASIAGPSFMFNERFYEHRSLPFVMIASPADAMVNYEANAAPIPERVDNALLVTIDDASHTGFASAARYLRWMDNPDKLGCEQIKENVDAAGAEPWYREIGTPEEGVVAVEAPPLCETDPLPTTMNPLRQHWLTKLAVTAFFQSQFADTESARAENEHFLTEVLPREIPEISVRP